MTSVSLNIDTTFASEESAKQEGISKNRATAIRSIKEAINERKSANATLCRDCFRARYTTRTFVSRSRVELSIAACELHRCFLEPQCIET
jgi:hypothetical protein